MTAGDFTIRNLGPATIQSPLGLSTRDGDFLTNYVADEERVLFDFCLRAAQAKLAAGMELPSFEMAGPRENIFFDPAKCRVGIVTCGGLCPGLNDVIRALVMQLSFWYHVKTIYGFRYGFQGMVKDSGLAPLVLDPDMVADIHSQGGTILGSSRGPQDVGKMVDRLMDYGVSI